MRTRVRRCAKGALPGIPTSDCEALLQRVAEFHLPALDQEPCVLVHGDLQPSNIIIHEQRLER